MSTSKRKQRISFLLCLAFIACLGIATATKVSTTTVRDPNCQDYDHKQKICLKCCHGYYYDEETGLCQEVSQSCATWDETTGKCLSCFPGYGEPFYGICSPIPLNIDFNCKSYNDQRECIACFKGYHLDEHNYCVEGGDSNWDHCVKYCYIDSNGKHFNSYKKDCSLVCVECQDGYYLDWENKCQQFPQNCETVDETGTCINCKENYEFDENEVCVLVDESLDDNCAEYWWINSKGKWLSKWHSGCKKICKKCDEGYYLDSDYECIKYPPHCTAVDENYQCTSCSLGYRLNDDKQCVPLITTTPSDHCVDYCYINQKGNRFKKWVLGCKKICKECEQGYFLNSKHICIELSQNCLEAQQVGICTECVQHYEPDRWGNCVPVSGGPCDQHCAVYKYCDTKGLDFHKWFKGCKKMCKECDEGYFLTEDHVCIELPQNCVEVESDGTCIECEEGYETDQFGNCDPISGGPYDDHCAVYKYCDTKGLDFHKWFKGCYKICKECDEGYFLTEDHVCIELPQNCVEVDSEGTCTECAEGYETDQYGNCIPVPGGPYDDHCAVYKYFDTKGLGFQKWFKGCKKICKECDEGYFLTEDHICIKLPQNCLKVDKYGECTECEEGYETDKYGECAEVSNDHCAVYQYIDLNGGLHSKWSNGCKKICKYCDAGYSLENDGTCVVGSDPLCAKFSSDGSCEVCSFRSVKGKLGRCVEVDGQCNTWDNKTGHCTSCYGGYRLLKGKCVMV